MDNRVETLHIIPVDRDLRELTERGTPDFPVAMYDTAFSDYLTGKVPWHWHGETELIYLLKGEVDLRYGSQTATIRAGSGAFINANILHSMARSKANVPCRLLSIVFSPSLITGLPQGVCEQKFILPLQNCKKLPGMVFQPEVHWQAEVLDGFQTAFQAYKRHTFGYELMVIEELTGIWRRMVVQNRGLLHITKPRQDDDRIKQMLIYIQQNYEKRLTLSDIAASANISPRACTRCFQEKMHITPFAYLNALRVRVAAEKLRHTELSVGEIAEAVGFDGDSYFAKVFKSAIGCSPREYRNRSLLSPAQGG